MVTKRDRVHAGGFIISEEGPVSRDGGYLAAGENLEAGTLLEENDDGDLIAWTAGDNPIAGILYASMDATLARKAVATIARSAVVSLDGLTYPEGLAATSRDALTEIGIIVSSDDVIADTAGGGGGDYVAKAGNVSGGAALSIASLSFAPCKGFTYIGWHKVGLFEDVGYGTIFICDPADKYINYSGVVSHGGVVPGPQSGTWFGQTMQASLVGGPHGVIDWDGDIDSIPQEQWCCVISCMDGNSTVPAIVPYLGDAPYHVNTGFINEFTQDILGNGLPATIFDDTFGGFYIGDAADIRVLFGVSLMVDGDIPLATRRMIIDEAGKPVDPAVLTAFLGGPGTVLLQWTGTEWVNNGTGGAVIPNEVGTFADATTSPSD